ncbi:2-oxoglutarate dehydrogenase E2 component (dihydrolipoamide succinyltransferase) [Thermocatellispora tengchongensis]|uniref:Dihydrolipoamide acetyltransferase component of pyruvate dehydrogenase complex n=1 Tax=Thermocatellispora tengchongensis TaxID=1073253 RepID=A0A840PHZ0_9ACTN|nr:2-oxo acid dehydrogenase subunit E2 [Thermocatellispora tengchongensis]MBB5136737.1 2-oxoglutarate dehydrogenase E2 component (dihydrolipoamide succinyltransferase) [Thermocatellispora tengchongensis]
MTEIQVPKLNNNDGVYLLTAWTAKDGEAVRAGDPIAELETSKAIEELTAHEDGVLRHLLPEGAECAPGQVIARLERDGETAPPRTEPAAPAEPAAPGQPVVTEPARRFIAQHGIPMERVNALGVKVVRRADVEALAPAEPEPMADAAEGPKTGLVESSPIQRRIAETVERSHREIPSAFTLMRVDVTETLVFAREESRRSRVLIGLPELLVKAVGDLLGRFPVFFATPVDARRVAPADVADVGVTMDVGHGMVVPVIRDAGGRTLAEIARDLTRLRQVAMKGRFREEDLRGGAIMVTLHTENGVIMAAPLVFPGQICALALTAPRSEVVQTAAGHFTTRQVVSLGLSYDHRFVNGREAAEFLGALRPALESPGRS